MPYDNLETVMYGIYTQPGGYLCYCFQYENTVQKATSYYILPMIFYIIRIYLTVVWPWLMGLKDYPWF